MRLFDSRIPAMIAGAGIWLLLPCGARADEPVKPTASATEANPAVPAPGHSLHGEAFDDGPRHAAHLMPDQGKVHFPVSTKNAEAQKFVDQGVAQLHSFLYFESERSFRQAGKLDPGCAMAYWGMAMSNVNNPRRAKGFLKEARARAAALSPRELLYLSAFEAYEKDGANDRARRQGWLSGLEAIVQDFPDDINARAWLAMVTWQNQMDGIGSRQAVDVVIDSVLQVESMHPGAHHYRIHLWDSHKALRAVGSAGLYAKTAPGIAHAWHMPGHTFTELKRYADAAYQQEGSARVDHAYMSRDRVMPFEIHNYAHNNQWLCTSLSHIGRARDAISVARNLVEQPRDPGKNGPNDGGSAQRSGRARWSELLVRYELWDDLIAATTSGALDWSNIPFEAEQKAYTLGLAHAARNEPEKLAAQIESLRKLTSSGAKSALAELEGWQFLARGETGPAFDSFAKATSMRPEALAQAHLKARNFGFAEVKAKDAVARNPNQVVPLAAEVEILHACGKDKEAREAYRLLGPLARSADQDLPVFKRLAKIVERWKAEKTWTESIAAETDHSQLRKSLVAEREKIREEIKAKRAELEKLARKRERGQTQTPRSLIDRQRERVADEMIKTDLEIIVVEVNLAAAEEAVGRKAKRDQEVLAKRAEEWREQQIRNEFRQDPEVIALTEEIATAAEGRDHVKQISTKKNDPARLAADKTYRKLMDQYTALWKVRYEELSAQLKPANPNPADVQRNVDELAGKLKSLRTVKEKQTKLFENIQRQTAAVEDEDFEASFIKRQLEMLSKSEEQISRNLDELKVDLTTLGPLTWAPFAAEPFSRTDTAGAKWSLADKKGKNVLLLFFLGGKCAHCMQQLQVFGKEFDGLNKLNIETVAIGTDDLEASKVLKNNKDGIKFPMPILPDPKHEIFKLYQAFDDFEGQPLHGTILIDGQGKVRFQRISAEPFLDVEFIKGEAARASRIVVQQKN